jgi:hypothetical protein
MLLKNEQHSKFTLHHIPISMLSLFSKLFFSMFLKSQNETYKYNYTESLQNEHYMIPKAQRNQVLI